MKTGVMSIVVAASMLAVAAYGVEPKDSVERKPAAPKGGNNNGYWITASVVKAGVGNNNPSITLRTANGDYTYTVNSRNNSQILNLATQAIVYNLNVQVYTYSDYCNGYYISALYLLGNGVNPPPPPPPQAGDNANQPDNPPEIIAE